MANRNNYQIEIPDVAMGDINGDGVVDVVESNYGPRAGILKRNKVPQFYYLLDKEQSLQANTTTASKLFDAHVSGRSVDIGQLFDDSQLPDIVHGMVDGSLRIFANMGVDSSNTFLGFEERGVLNVGSDCEILEVMIANLSPCTVSLICALACGIGNVIFSTPTSCQEGSPRNPIQWVTSMELADLQLSNFPTMAPTMKPSTANPTLVPSQFPTAAPSYAPTSGFPSASPTFSPSQLPTYFASDSPSNGPTLSSEDLLTSTSPALSSNTTSDVPRDAPSHTSSQSPHSRNSSPSNIIPNDVSSTLLSDFPSLSPSESPSASTPTNRVHQNNGASLSDSQTSDFPSNAPSSRPSNNISQASGSSGEEFTDMTSIDNQVRSWHVVLLAFSSITVVFLVLGLANRSMSRREQKRQDRIIQVYTNTSMVPFGGEGINTQDSPSIVSVYFVATDDNSADGKGDTSPTNVDLGGLLAQALTVSSGPISPAVGRNCGSHTFWDSPYAGTVSNLLTCETAEEDTAFLLKNPTTSPIKWRSDRTTRTWPVVPSSNIPAQFA